MSNNVKIAIYRQRRAALFNAGDFLDMVRDLWGSRELIQRLVLRDFSVRYRQSVLGYFWAVVPQLVTVGIFAFLTRYRVFDMGQPELPYLVHALWSISLWQLFSVSLVGCTDSLVNAGSLVTKVNFPKEAIVISSAATACVDFAIRLVPILIAMAFLGFIPSLNALFILPIVLLVLMLAIGLGFILSVINLVVRDMGNMVAMVMTFGMFLAPILYPPPTREPFSLVNVLNPFSPLLIATQESLAGSTWSHPLAFAMSALLALFLFLLGWRVFRITLPRVAERA